MNPIERLSAAYAAAEGELAKLGQENLDLGRSLRDAVAWVRELKAQLDAHVKTAKNLLESIDKVHDALPVAVSRDAAILRKLTLFEGEQPARDYADVIARDERGPLMWRDSLGAMRHRDQVEAEEREDADGARPRSR